MSGWNRRMDEVDYQRTPKYVAQMAQYGPCPTCNTSRDLVWRQCKVICAACGTIILTCGDL